MDLGAYVEVSVLDAGFRMLRHSEVTGLGAWFGGVGFGA